MVCNGYNMIEIFNIIKKWANKLVRTNTNAKWTEKLTSHMFRKTLIRSRVSIGSIHELGGEFQGLGHYWGQPWWDEAM